MLLNGATVTGRNYWIPFEFGPALQCVTIHNVTRDAAAAATSKGAPGGAGAGFVVLAATLGSVGSIPVAGIALVLGVPEAFGVPCAVPYNAGDAHQKGFDMETQAR